MLNNITILGRMVKDPELKRTQSDVPYVTFTVAIERNYVAKGEERETDFIDCRAWRGTAEFVAKYFPKGSWIGVEGDLQTNVYEAQDGSKRKAYYIQCRQVSFAGSSGKQEQKPAGATVEAQVQETGLIPDNDIPF